MYMNQFSFCLVAPPGLCVKGWFIDQTGLCNRFMDVCWWFAKQQPHHISQDKQHEHNYSCLSVWVFQTFPSQLLSAVSWLKPVVNPPLWNGKQCRPVHAPGLSTWFCVVSPDFKTPAAKLISEPIDRWGWIIGPMTMIWISVEPRIR